MTPQTFYKLYYHSAVISERKTNVPALVILAQAAVESGWGEHAPGNMFFGIKATATWKGKKQLITTTEIHSNRNVKYPEIISITAIAGGKYKYKVRAWFRAYDNAAESFSDHGEFLRTNPRYANAFLTNSPSEFVDEISIAGYATDPQYAITLKKVIKMLEKIMSE